MSGQPSSSKSAATTVMPYVCVALLIPQPGSLRHVGKGSIPIVVIEPVLSEISTENIVESVVVVVSYANTASPANSLQARFFSYVREGAIAIISIEAVRGVSGMAI